MLIQSKAKSTVVEGIILRAYDNITHEAGSSILAGVRVTLCDGNLTVATSPVMATHTDVVSYLIL